MKTNKLGPFLLSGLIIGPILGSGIIILPPLIHQVTGDYALVAWILMMALSIMFAFLFGKLSILYPGDSGASLAVEQAFGKSFRTLSANFLILAVCLGPIAVLSTAAEYLHLWLGWNPYLITLGLMILTYSILSMNIMSVGKLSLILSSSIAFILVTGAIISLLYYRGEVLISTPFEWPSFGYSLLLLFWCLVGWEIVGNYSGEVREPSKTIPRAIVFSAIVITVVSLTVAAAVQWMDPATIGLGSEATGKLDMILVPLFGSFSLPVISLITTALCISTALMVIGGVSRLICAQAEQGIFPLFLAARTKNHVPFSAMMALFTIHLITFTFVLLDWATLKQLVAVADGFFLCNALLGILAAFKLVNQGWVRTIAIFLAICFLGILLFSNVWVLILIALLTSWPLYTRLRMRVPDKNEVNNIV
ncbi:APC family permease [Ammoniphilus sp. CFH 90114]|uniref:APC family permease n=1 Tax=Ammoniphilus sp. CFH 90114 TaxID=2493665 RepID=UPI00100FA2FD|nr:amino acid permease [Ammoniphilus sp. CFH 90114]RXT06356.1 amino acid permease [Ammoniphilus sp. CFH 90114]